MRKFEYKAIPAPSRGTKAKGVKSAEDRFALSMSESLNEMAEDGWEYVRAETLPCDVRKGLTGTQTLEQNVLIFRRPTMEPLPLDRTTSRPLSVPSPEPVSPRRVTTGPVDQHSAPSVGAADDRI